MIRLGSLLLGLLILVGALFLVLRDTGRQKAAQAAPEPPPPQLLSRGDVVKREIAGSAVHPYAIPFRKGDFLDLRVRQPKVDLVLTFLDSEGQKLFEVDDFPTGGTERLFHFSGASGRYRLQVRAFDSDGAEGHYELEVFKLGQASPRERRLFSAVQALRDAERLRRGRDCLKALTKYEEALNGFEGVDDIWRQGVVLRRMGHCRSVLGRIHQAVELYQQSLTRFETLQEHGKTVFVLNDIGRAYRALGQSLEAYQSHRRALEIASRHSQRSGEAASLTAIGLIEKSWGESREALDSLRRAEVIWRELGDRGRIAEVLEHQGLVYSLAGRMDSALDSFRQGLKIRQELRHRRAEAGTRIEIGWVHYHSGELDEAMNQYRLALQLSEETGDLRRQAGALDRMGTVMRKRKDYPTSLGYYKRSLGLSRQGGFLLGEAHTLINFCELHVDWKKPKQALHYCAQADRLFEGGIDDPNARAHILYLKARAERDLDRPGRAAQLMAQVLQGIESLRLKSSAEGLRTAFFSTRSTYQKFAVDLLMTWNEKEPEKGFDALALEISLHSRARSLLDTLVESESKQRAGVSPRLLQRLQELQEEVSDRHWRRLQTLSMGAPEEGASLEDELRNLLLEVDELEGEIRRAQSEPVPSRPQPLPLSEIQKEILDADTLLLTYSLGKKKSYIWWVTPTSLGSSPLPAGEEIEKKSRLYRELLSRSRGRGVQGQLETIGASLSEMLLGPVQDQIQGRTLLLVGEGEIQLLPFGALPIPSGGGRLLVEDSAVVYLPSLSMLQALRRAGEERPNAPNQLVVMADAVFNRDDPRVGGSPQPESEGSGGAEKSGSAVLDEPQDVVLNFDRLLFTRDEAHFVASTQSTQSLQVLGLNATREFAMRRLGSFRILHIATHSRLHPRLPELSALVFSLYDRQGRLRDGLWRAHEIYRSNLQAELVVLSACNTGLGPTVIGEGVLGLARSFLHAGAERVVVSLWSVDDESTAYLMERFYQEMFEYGKRPSAAMQAAQTHMWRETRWKAPYYWAGFVFHGEWKATRPW